MAGSHTKQLSLRTCAMLAAALATMALCMLLACPHTAYAASGDDLTAGGAGATAAASSGKKAKPSVKYSAYVKGKGWTKWRKAGKTAGKLNKYKRLEGLRIALNSGGRAGTLQFRAYVSGKGWTDWQDASSKAGRIAKKRGIAVLQMRLTGELGQDYEVLYRTHISKLGWQGYFTGGAEAGSLDRRDRIDGVSIKLVAKGSGSKALKAAQARDAKNAKARSAFDNRLATAQRIANGQSSATGSLVTVDLTNHWLCIFRGSQGHWTMVKNWQVSNGKKGHRTPTGSFSVGSKGPSFGHGYTCYHYTQITGPYFFHSILYNQGTHKVQDGRLGRYISQGCVRMKIGNALWLQRNVPGGSRIKIYN